LKTIPKLRKFDSFGNIINEKTNLIHLTLLEISLCHCNSFYNLLINYYKIHKYFQLTLKIIFICNWIRIWSSYLNKNVILSLKIRVKLNVGEYKALESFIIYFNCIINIYLVENLDVVGNVYMTNTTPTTKFRGLCFPQTIIVMEMFIHHFATKQTYFQKRWCCNKLRTFPWWQKQRGCFYRLIADGINILTYINKFWNK